MVKHLKLELNTTSINDLIKDLVTLELSLKNVGVEISKELANDGVKKAKQLFDSTYYQEGSHTTKITSKKTGKGYRVIASGQQVIYDEFGTGEMGASSGHPWKGSYDLNPYNSGGTIRTNSSSDTNASEEGIPNGGLYWTFVQDGVKYYTQGVPAGKQMYNTTNHMRNQIRTIAKQKVGEIISKL